MSAALDRLVAALAAHANQEPSRRGEAFLLPCPCHLTKRALLTVEETPGGSLLVRCSSTPPCTLADVLATLDLSPHDLTPIRIPITPLEDKVLPFRKRSRGTWR